MLYVYDGKKKLAMQQGKIVIDLLDEKTNTAPPRDVSNGIKTTQESVQEENRLEGLEQQGVAEGIIESIKESVKAEEEKPIEEQAVEEGMREAVKEMVKEEEKQKEKLEGMTQLSNRVLLRIRNIIPLLPDEVIVDVTKITIVYRYFFFTERIHSISIKDITDVYIETMPFLASINLIDAGFTENLVRVRWLKKAEAEKARRIITGLMEASKEGIDLTLLEDEALKTQLEELGKVKELKASVSTG